VALLEHPLVVVQHDQRRNQHDQAVDPGNPVLGQAQVRVNGLVDPGAQREDLAGEAEKGGNFEDGDRRHEIVDRGRRDRRNHQGRRYAPEDLPETGPGYLPDLLQLIVDLLEGHSHHEEHQGRQHQALDEGDARHVVDAERASLEVREEANQLVRMPLCGLSRNIQAIAFRNPGMMPATSIRVI
jgi:hypothetical protein